MFARIRSLLFNTTSGLIAVVALSSFLIASYQLETWPFADQRPLRERYVIGHARRTALEPTLMAPGRVESSESTVIRCELENISSSAGSSGGAAAAAAAAASGGASTILWLLPEGSQVKKGDVVCRLDASSFDEMLRQQTIVVEQARSSDLQAELDLEIARIALREFLEGTVQETVQSMEANLRLARSNLTQAAQRLDWSRMMNKKGYASIAQIKTDEQTVITSELTLQQQEMSYNLFKKFTLVKTTKTLQADITTAQTTLDSEKVKLNRQLERYELLKKQLARCTIKAPHDGVLYYYVDPHPRRGEDAPVIEEGLAVRQEQKLFYLPDLSKMEVHVVLNESVVSRVVPGMTATVTFEALPSLELTGKLTSVSEIPAQAGRRGEDIRFFQGVLKLDHSADGLKPGMTAMVNFRLQRSQNVLTIPPQALVAAGGHYACYIPGDDRLTLKPITVGRITPALIEVKGGLAEGDEVILDPPGRSTGRPRTLAGFDARTWTDDALAAIKAPARPARVSSDAPRRRRGGGQGGGFGGRGGGGFGGRGGGGFGGRGGGGGFGGRGGFGGGNGAPGKRQRRPRSGE